MMIRFSTALELLHQQLITLRRGVKQRLQALLQPRSESTDYQAWRHQFMRDRLRLCLWLATSCFLTFFALNIHSLLLYPQAFNNQMLKLLGDPEFVDRLRNEILVIQLWLAISLIGCLILQRTTWGNHSPIAILIAISWSIALVPQIAGTVLGIPYADPGTWTAVFLGQALLVPVYWRVHLMLQLGVLIYYVMINSLLGMTAIGTYSIFSVHALVSLLWISAICDLGVYLYERLKRSEFESQRQLRILLHAVSHDLRTPVMGISVVLQNLLRKPEQKLTIDRAILEQLLQGSDRQLTLIHSLLEAQTTEAQGIKLCCQPVEISSLVEEVLSNLAPVFRKNWVTLNNQICSNLPLVKADKTQIWRVFDNLMTNALKHNPPGIWITLNAEVIELETAQSRNSQCFETTRWLRCEVRDTGVGISPDLQGRLFELYSRGDRARYMPGVGLGLYLCHQIIAAHGGQIGVSSQLHQGSAFWFTLPVA
ncbi:HAMP domain-containing histidine kinase [bacterium]|nr:HAMP domain-containing histidine kinase [bacterium]